MNRPRLEEEFQRNFAERGELGASLSIWQHGREVVSLAAGFRDRSREEPWTARTPVLFWSATKALSAACLLHACAARKLPLETPAGEVWPDFAAAGKAAVMIAEILSHRAGLPTLRQAVPVTDYQVVVAALAAEEPFWPHGEGHGYHPRTYGFLVEELVRRISGRTLREYWQIEFAVPLGLDLWIGVPPERVAEVAPIYPARSTPPKGDPFYLAFLSPETLTARSFASPSGLHSANAMNTLETRMASYGGFGGIGTAHSLGKFYALLAQGGEWEGCRYFTAETLRQMQIILTQGHDRTLLMETAFSAGYMKDPVDSAGRKVRQLFGPSLAAFGQPGAGGSHAFADAEHGLAFAYVMNQMDPGVLPSVKAMSLVEALYG